MRASTQLEGILPMKISCEIVFNRIAGHARTRQRGLLQASPGGADMPPLGMFAIFRGRRHRKMRDVCATHQKRFCIQFVDTTLAMLCVFSIAALSRRSWASNVPSAQEQQPSLAAKAGKSRKKKSKKKQHKVEKRLGTLSLAELGNIKVTSVTKEPEEVWRTSAAIYVITQEDIRRSGVTTIPDALRLAPGVEVAQMDSDHWAVAIRGFNSQFSRYLLVLIDGRNVYSPLQGGVYWEFQMVPLADVDRIEIIRGPGGTIWGPNAVNGVVNIITKNAKDTHGSLLTAGGGNIDRGSGEYRYGGSVGSNLNYRVYGMGFDRGPEYHSDHDPFDSWTSGEAGFRADWSDDANDSLTFEGDIYKADDGLRTSIASYVPAFQGNVDGDEDGSGGDISGRWERTFEGGSNVAVQGYFERTNLLTPQLGEIRNTFDLDFVHSLALGKRQGIVWGLGMDLSPRDFIQTVPTVNILPHHLTDGTYSGFVQDNIAITRNRLWLTLGSKIVDDNYTGLELEPSARILWTPGPRESAWAAVTRAVRTPSDLDEGLQLTGLLTTTPLPIYVQILGDGRFFSEQMVGYEAGYRSLLASNFYLDVATFHNDYNYVESYGSGSPYAETQPLRVIVPFPYVNGLMGSTNGFEITPDWKLKRWWDLKGSYSFLNMDLRTRPGFIDTGVATTDEGSSPQNEIVFQSQFNLPKRLEFDPTYRYVSSLPALSIPAYGTADLHIGWRATQHLELSVTGENLLQPRHAEFSESVGPPVEIERSGFAKITLRW
jgi:iron complex outermembrane recepter protein